MNHLKSPVGRPSYTSPVLKLPHPRPPTLVRLLLGLMLLMAVLPALSRLVQAGQGDRVELCSVQGSRWVSLDAAEGGEPALQLQDAGCAACLLQAQGMAPPPAAPALALRSAALERAQGSPETPRLMVVWRRASSRGPPERA